MGERRLWKLFGRVYTTINYFSVPLLVAIMSHRQVAVRYGEKDPDDRKFYDADDFGHDTTQEHDQIVLARSEPAQQPSSTSTGRDRPAQPGGQWPWPQEEQARQATEGRRWTKPSKTFTESSRPDWPYKAPEPYTSTSPAHTSSQGSTPLNPSTSSSQPFKWPYHSPTSSTFTTLRPVDQPHLNTPHASTFTTSDYSPSSPTEQSSGRPLSSESDISTSSASTIDAADIPSDIESSTAIGSEDSFIKTPIPGLQHFSNLFDPSLRGAPHDSPISPLTVRDHFPQGFPQGSDVTDSPSQDSRSFIGRSPLSREQPEPDFEGVSLQEQPFSRPGSQRSSTASSTSARRVPALLITEPSHHVVASKLFLDPFGPQSADQPQLGLPSIRHITASTDGDGKMDPPPDVFRDSALVNHLETLQRDATDCWERAASAASEQERETLVNGTVSRLWHTSVSFLADMLRSHKMLRQLASIHRLSLGEIDRLRQYSEDTEGKVVQKERNLSLDLDGLKAENKQLRQQLALRDLTAAREMEVSVEKASMVMGTWVKDQPYVPNSSSQVARPAHHQPLQTVEEEIQPDKEPGETTKEQLKDWPAIQPPLKAKPWEDVQRRESWQPDPASVVEMLQKIKQLREDLQHERFEKEAALEQIHQLEQQADLFHGFEATDEPSKLDSARETATKRMAEIVGLRAALKTAQQNYETEKGWSAQLQRTCDGFEDRVAERAHKIMKLERELKDVKDELYQERRELTDARLEAEEREVLVANLQEQIEAKTKEVSRLDSEMKLLIADLNATQADLVELQKKNEKLAEDLYDQQTDNGMQLQDLEYEKYMRAQEKAELDQMKETLDQTKEMLAETEHSWSEHCVNLANEIKEYEEAVAEHKATEAQLQKDLDLLNKHLAELEVADCEKTDEIQAQKERIDELMQNNQSIGDTNKRLAEYLKSQRLGEGWEYVEEIRLRCQSLERQRATWAPAFIEMNIKKNIAEMRHQRKQRNLRKARFKLEVLREQRHLDVERMKEMAGLINFLEMENEDVRQQKIVTRTVEHHHSEACFCSLVEYWFPGALERVLPRRRETDDSGYDSGSIDGGDDPRGIGPAPESHADPDDDFFSDSPRSVTSENQTHEAEAISTPSPTHEDYSTYSKNHVVEYEGLESPPLRGGAGTPPSPASQASSGYEEKMAAVMTADDWWDRPITPEPGNGDGDASSQSSGDRVIARAFPGSPPLDTRSPWPVEFGEVAETGEQSPGLVSGQGSPGAPVEDALGDPYIEEILQTHPRSAGTGSSTSGIPQVEYGGVQEVVRGKHTTRAGERIDVKRRDDGGLKLRISMDKKLSVDRATSERSAPQESTAHTDEVQPEEVESAVEDSEEENPEEEDSEEAEQPQAESSKEESSEEESSVAQPEEAPLKEAQQEEAPPEEAQPPQAQPSVPQPTTPQPPQPSPFPRRRPRRISFAVSDSDPAASLLSLLNTSLRTPPLDRPFSSTVYSRRARPHYHGHTASDGPFNGPGHLLCQLLTALAWLGMLILSQPSNFFSTVAIFVGYFFLPLRYILSLIIYYIRLPPFYAKSLLLSLFSRRSPPNHPIRPAKPVLGRVSAAAIVSSVVSLMVVFLLIALEVVRYERETWLQANRWTDAYLRDVIDRRPYPWWSPIDVDVRLAALEWSKWKMNVLAFGQKYVKTW